VYKDDLTELSAIVAEDSKSLLVQVQTQVQQHGPVCGGGGGEILCGFLLWLLLLCLRLNFSTSSHFAD
jgi:hypothetical protein